VGSAAAPSLAVLAAAQALVGVALAVLLGAGVAAAGEWVPAAGRSRTLAWALAGPPAAWIVGMPAVAATGSWRVAWLAVPLLSTLVALAAVALLRPIAPAVDRPHDAAARAGERGIAAWAIGETLLFAAWGGTLVYAGALLRDSYAISLWQTGLALGAAAVAYLPGTFLARRWAETSAHRLLVASGSAAALLTAVFGIARPTVGFSVAIFAALAFVAAARTFAGGVYAVQATAKRRAAMTSARAAAMQFGYLLGAGVGAVTLSAGGYNALGATLAGLFALTVVPHLRPPRSVSSVVRPAIPRSRPLRSGALETGN
jgi:predicted MFS family arabinose efflux permease